MDKEIVDSDARGVHLGVSVEGQYTVILFAGSKVMCHESIWTTHTDDTCKPGMTMRKGIEVRERSLLCVK